MLPKWFLFAIWSALIFQATCDTYEVRGWSSAVSSVDIDPSFADNFSFEKKHELVVKQMAEIIGNDFESFEIFDYKIHGVDTAVFHAHLTIEKSSQLTRQEIIDRIIASDDKIRIYVLTNKGRQNVNANAPRFRIKTNDDVTSCQNGGILLPNATCSCPPYRSGAQCEITSCRNNGVVETGQCVCPPGLYSMNCESRTCVGKIASTVDFSSQSLILVVNIRTSMAFDLTTIIENIPTLIADYSNQGVPIWNYILTVYIYKKPTYFMETMVFTSADELIDFLQKSVAIYPSNDDQPILDAIASTQSTSGQLRAKSIIFSFADSENLKNPSPSTLLTTANESLVIQQTLSWRNKIVLVLSQFEKTPLSPTGNYFDVLRRVITATHGDLLIVDKLELPEILTHTFFYFINGQNTFVQYYNNKAKTIPITSDSSTIPTNILITVENGATVPGVNDKNGNRLTPTSAGKRFALYRVTQSVSDSIQIVAGDSGVPTHSTRVWFTSTFDVLISYSNDDSIDNGYAHTFNGIQHRPTIYSSLPMTSSLVVSQWDSFNSTVIQGASESTSRPSSCIFQFQLNSSANCTPGPFVHNVQVSTTSNNVYYRAVPGYCFTPDSHIAPPFSCLNNGTRAGNKCSCPSNYQGIYCQTPVCQNGGTPDNFPNGNGHGLCICPFGVNGLFCERLVCDKASDDEFQSFNRSFAVVLQSSLSASAALSNLNSGLSVMLQYGKSTDFEEFILTTYKNRIINNATLPDVSSMRYSTASQFLNATTADQLGFSYSPSGPQPGLLALDTTLRSLTHDKSSVFFFTDAPTSDQEYGNNFEDILQIVISREIEISIIVIPPYGLTDFCDANNNYLIYENLAQQSGGNFINLCLPYVNTGDPVVNFISSYGLSHHHTEVIGYWLAPDCTNFNTETFYVTDPNNDAFLIVNSPTIQNFTVQLTDASTGAQQIINPDAYAVPFFGSHRIKIAAGSSLSFIANIKGVSPGICFVRVVEKSQFSAYLGFSPNPAIDRYSKFLTYGTRQLGVVHLSSVLQSQPKVSAEVVDQTNQVSMLNFVKRTSGCRYEYVASQEFSCHTAGSAFTVKTLITTPEVTIQRTQRAYCQELSVCQNGGIENNGTCHCADGYGSLHCEVPLCQNGGSIHDFKCECPTGFDGDLCEYQKCNDWNFIETHDPREKFPQQIIFVVEVKSLPVAIANMLLINNIDSFISSTDDITNPRQYSLITFDDQNVNVVVSSSNRQTFVSAFKNAMIFDSKTPASVLSLDALSQAYKIVDQLPAVIYLLTGTAPARSSTADASRQRFGVQVNTVWFSNNYETMVPSNVSPYLVAAARQSNGRILTINPLRTDELLNVFASGITENQLILDDGAQSCSGSGVTFSFPVELKTISLVFAISGRNVKLTVKDEKSNIFDTINSTLLDDQNSRVVFASTQNHTAGTWTVNITGSSSCYIQVRAVTTLQVVPKFTNDQSDDFGSTIPRVGAGSVKSSYITFRLAESQFLSDQWNYGGTVDSVEGWSTDLESPWLSPSLASNSSVVTRDYWECSSQYVTPLIQWQSTYEKFIVKGRDSSGANYQRTFFFSATAKAQDCLNNATVDQYGFCQCDANHFGSICEFRRCKNGGISAYGLCDCPNGFYGNYCEQFVKS